MTKKELYATARTLNIRGRSKMNKAQLIRAIECTEPGFFNRKECDVETTNLNAAAQSLNLNRDKDKGPVEDVIMVDTSEPTNEEVAMYWIDEEDVERVYEVLKAATEDFVPSELFHDLSPDTYEGTEDELNQLVDIQERIATGLAKINKFVGPRNKALREYILYSQRLDIVENAWKGLAPERKNRLFKRYSARKRELVQLRRQAWKTYEQHKAVVDKPENKAWLDTMWNHWRSLVETCTSSSSVWRSYFELKEYDYFNFFCDTKDVDEMTLWNNRYQEMNDLRDNHLKDMEAYKVHVEIQPPKGGYVPPCRTPSWFEAYNAFNTGVKEIGNNWVEEDETFEYLVDNFSDDQPYA